jgi:hypothetical protein
MDKAERFRVLLNRGYFPDELPPPFHTEELARFRASTARAWDAAGDERSSAPGLYSLPRVGRFRRVLSIVNPVPQLYLSKLIAENWLEIRSHLRKSKISINTSEIETNNERAVSLPDFALMIAKQIEISATFDFAVIADISRFYGTLYTHVIPWALNGKDWCKRNLNTPSYRRSLGNRLDVLVRKGQENQTIGIPVGPDTSRILSEIVGVSIDIDLQNRLKIGRESAYRQIDGRLSRCPRVI